jgi:hypothetical protein
MAVLVWCKGSNQRRNSTGCQAGGHAHTWVLEYWLWLLLLLGQRLRLLV